MSYDIAIYFWGQYQTDGNNVDMFGKQNSASIARCPVSGAPQAVSSSEVCPYPAQAVKACSSAATQPYLVTKVWTGTGEQGDNAGLI
jgi:hypothetical protein